MKTLNNNLLKLKLRAAALARLRISGGFLITLNKINGTFTVKGKGLLAGAFRRMLPAMGLKVTFPMMGAILMFIDRCKYIHKTQGMPGLVKYLKAAGVLLQQALSGHVLKDCGTLGPRVSRNQSGLPRFIPVQHRARLRQGDLRIGQFWLTLINLFRVLEYKGKVNLGTITDPMAICPDSLKPVFDFVTSSSAIEAFCNALRTLTGLDLRTLVFSSTAEPFSIVKSSPQTVAVEGAKEQAASTKPFVLFATARALYNSGMADTVARAFAMFGRAHWVLLERLLRIFQRLALFNPPLGLTSLMPTLTGKLGFKDEPAGKVRVFAMVTAWDQWALRPLHDAMFKLLERVPQDGTHNQLGPLRFIRWGIDSLWSLDLTAATDRLPLFLQAKLLESLMRDKIGVVGELWSYMLVNRDYLASSSKYAINQMVRYATGQPMGALSSWASLALTHHFLVQAAAWHAGVVPFGTWFNGYAIVGDDLVIFDALVKDSYLKILAALGMPINQAKSILSPLGKGLEFCKRTIVNGRDISPIPLKEFCSANLTLPEAVGFANKYNLTFDKLLLTLGYGWKVRSGIGKHIGQLNARVRALLFAFMLPAILNDNGTDQLDQLGALLGRGNPQLSKEQRAYFLFVLLLTLKQFVISALNRILESRSSVATLVAKEMDGFNKVFVNRTLEPYLIQEAQGTASISDPRRQVVWTGTEKILGTVKHFLAEKAGTANTSIDVPLETLMGFRDLVHSVQDPLEELITWIIQGKVSGKTELMKELKQALKAFNPSLLDIASGFKEALHLLELLAELLDIDPSLDRVEINIPRRVASDKSQHLWMLFTSIINTFQKMVKDNPALLKESGHLARDIGFQMQKLGKTKV